jgi:hypothetical protein
VVPDGPDSGNCETQLLQVTREEGIWQGLLRWLEENPSHPVRQQVLEHFRHWQDACYWRERPYLGWAMYVLKPGME